MRIYLVISTAPRGEGERLGRTLVEERKAACVNIIKDVRSVFIWEGRVDEEGEEILLLKTSEDRLPELIKRLKEIHPYTVPEIISIPIDKGNEEYMLWVGEVLHGSF